MSPLFLHTVFKVFALIGVLLLIAASRKRKMMMALTKKATAALGGWLLGVVDGVSVLSFPAMAEGAGP